ICGAGSGTDADSHKSARGDTFDWWGYYWYEVFIGHETKLNTIKHCDTYGFRNVSGASGDLLCNGYGQVVSQVPGAISANVTNTGLVFIGGALLTGIADGLATAAAATAATDETGLYLAGKAPYQVTPGTTQLEGQYMNDLGRIEPWTAYYDQYGRLIARTDYNAGDAAQGIPSVHYHTYEWGPGKTPLETGSHIPGEYPH
ncbi:MAG TPA: hypothetical protein VI685_13260, partial [Candidatus Angelobacter sp.]